MSQFGFAGSPNASSQVAVASPSPVAASTSAPPPAVTPPSSAPGSAPSLPPPPRCCDSGRPLFTDPLTGQSVCTCQYDPQTHLLNYQRLASAGIPLSMYSAPYGDQMAAYFPALGADQAPFYTSTPTGLELKDGLGGAAAGWPYPSVYHPYDAAFAGYPFNGYGMDLNGARRKNATRETTSTLKAWLNEHKKNPYPTKGEKIMLAIITKMTLTQVSTWFANARRRLKKENKMTWEPRNRVEDDDNNNDDEPPSRKGDGKDHLDSKDSGTGSSEDGDRPPRLDLLHQPPRPDTATGSEWSESRPDSGPDSPECLFERPLLHHPSVKLPPGSPPSEPGNHGVGVGSVSKPRIWSLADMASKENDHHHHSPVSSAFYSAAAAAAAGKLVSPMARGLPPNHPHHPMAYARPPPHHPEFYRSLYGAGPAAAHLHGGEVSLLESYTRTFGLNGAAVGTGATGAPTPLSVLSKAAAVAAASGGSFLNGGGGLGPLGSLPPPAPSSASSSSSSMEQQLQSAGLLTAVRLSASPPPLAEKGTPTAAAPKA